MKREILKTFTLLLVVAMTSCSAIYEDGQELASGIQQDITGITVDELNAKIENGEDFLLIDVRQKDEFTNSAITGALNIPRGTLEFTIRNDEFWEEEFLYTPENDQEIIVYCKLGHRGALAALALQQIGFTNVKYLQGGILAWDPNIEKNAPKKSSGGGCGD
ncbi:MAG: rhodanese-like domain-containing protein [Bacteroidales bacterium]|nr:rhodanese-like domain-containing protein [Bacteroidales bacterium]